MSRATPRLRMFAGPNGSGKSKIKAVVEAEIRSELFGVYINADDIESSIRQTGYHHSVHFPVHRADKSSVHRGEKGYRLSNLIDDLR